jgi:polyphosphate glucokinase
MPKAKTKRATRSNDKPVQDPAVTLAIDIGGTGLKATLVDGAGTILADRLRVDTPYPATPERMVDTLVKLVEPLPSFDRISIGFPGVVRGNNVITAPHFGTEQWRKFPLATKLSQRLGKPARLLNDADVQGYGAIRGRGLEFVITLGTGLGSALFRDGELMPHMEFAHYPIRGKRTFNQYVGNAALKQIGVKRWNRRVERVIEAFRTLFLFDTLYIGGGNAKKVTLELPRDVKIVSNEMGLTGGIRLWGAAGGQTPKPGPA